MTLVDFMIDLISINKDELCRQCLNGYNGIHEYIQQLLNIILIKLEVKV